MPNTEIQELKNILTDFIVEQKQFNAEQIKFNEEQKQFNAEQRQFNEEQKIFNKEIDKKIDKTQYYLEETMASHTKMFFEEQMDMKVKVENLNEDVFNIKNDLISMMSEFKLFKQNYL